MSKPRENLKPSADRYVTASEAADFLGTTVNTLNYWRAVGRGPTYYRLGRSIRYRLSELQTWAEQGVVRGKR